MLSIDSTTDDIYNEKLVARLRDTYAAAVAGNSGIKQSRKQLNMLLDARRTQKKLVGNAVEYKPTKAPEEFPTVEVEPDVEHDADETRELMLSMLDDCEAILDGHSDNDDETE